MAGLACLDRPGNMYVIRDNVCTRVDALEEEEEEEERVGVRCAASSHDSSDDDSVVKMSPSELARLMRLEEYTPHLLFKHQSFLRQYPFWGHSPTDSPAIFPTSTDLNIASKIDRAYVAPVVIGPVPDCGLGLFAAADFQRTGEFICEYTGLLDEGTAGGENDSYSINYPSLDSAATLSALRFGNVARCINHSARSPNVVFRSVFHTDGVLHVVCLTIAAVDEGAQLLVDYGVPYWVSAGCEPAELS